MLDNSRQVHTKDAISNKLIVTLTFLATLALCLLLVILLALSRSRVERLTMERLILEKSIKIHDVISKLLYKTHVISTIIVRDHGDTADFEQVAGSICDDPAILNILAAPGGIVTMVYPTQGNEAVIGHDFFSEGVGNKEALLAKETGQLVLGGPFDAVQGGQILVGRLPVFIDLPNGTSKFWGLVSVTLRYPDVLEGAGLNELQIQGYAYEIWRINPDSGERQVIAGSGDDYGENTHYVERQLSIVNAEWNFRILPVRAWYEFSETWAMVFASLCISFLAAAVIKNNQDLRALKEALYEQSNTDPLTGISNRRCFMDTAEAQMAKVCRENSRSFIILIDFDNFKQINDRHGHLAGDSALKEISARVARSLRPYDVFARYGGEEFIIFVADIDKDSVIGLAERIRADIADTPLVFCGERFYITASLGIAPAAPANGLDAAISLSDKALYEAKAGGRNMSVFIE